MKTKIEQQIDKLLASNNKQHWEYTYQQHGDNALVVLKTQEANIFDAKKGEFVLKGTQEESDEQYLLSSFTRNYRYLGDSLYGIIVIDTEDAKKIVYDIKTLENKEYTKFFDYTYRSEISVFYDKNEVVAYGNHLAGHKNVYKTEKGIELVEYFEQDIIKIVFHNASYLYYSFSENKPILEDILQDLIIESHNEMEDAVYLCCNVLDKEGAINLVILRKESQNKAWEILHRQEGNYCRANNKYLIVKKEKQIQVILLETSWNRNATKQYVSVLLEVRHEFVDILYDDYFVFKERSQNVGLKMFYIYDANGQRYKEELKDGFTIVASPWDTKISLNDGTMFVSYKQKDTDKRIFNIVNEKGEINRIAII
ncbi:MAG: hypothetical protein GXP45_01885 [bacterium]|nr:hypothetical protein [bacterium]